MPLPTIPSGNVNSGLATGYDVANSVRYNDGDSPKLNINFGSDGTLNKWTFSMWFKCCVWYDDGWRIVVRRPDQPLPVPHEHVNSHGNAT